MNRSLTLDGGIRVDGKLIEQGSDKYSPLQETNKKISNEWEKPSISLSLGSSYKLDERHNLLARFGYSRQEPDSFLATVGNKTLDTEQRLKYELGAEGKYNPAFNPGVTMFYYDIQNFAYSAATGGTGTSVYNIYDTANVGRKGVEATVKGSLPLGFAYNAGYSYITTDRADTNKVMPHNTVNLRLSHQLGALETNLILNYVSSYENNFLSNVDPVTKQAIYRPAGDYTRLDMNVSYSFKLSDAKAKATLYGRNLLDDRYVTIAGWRDQGLTYGGKLEVSF
jgi:iron complex outermembrane receptor protein